MRRMLGLVAVLAAGGAFPQGDEGRESEVPQGALTVAQGLFKAESYEAAAVAAFDVMGDPAHQARAGDAQLLLGKALYRLGHLQSALTQFSALLSDGAQTPQGRKAIEWVVFISRKTALPDELVERLAAVDPSQFPARYQHELLVLLARYHLEQAWRQGLEGDEPGAARRAGEALRLVNRVPGSSAHHAEAQYLAALASVHGNDLGSAVNALKRVLRLTAPGARSADPALRQLAFMQLGRLAYGQGQFRHALAYYGKIDRSSRRWLEAQFESAWASFRLGHDDRAMGNLVTLFAPFFREEYFPEAHLLRALTLYENCQYREAVSAVDTFERAYQPLRARLAAVLQEELPPSEFYARHQALGEDAEQDALRKLALSAARTDRVFAELDGLIRSHEEELAALEEAGDTLRFSGLGQRLTSGLRERRDRLQESAGARMKSKLQFESRELTRLVSNALRIRVEVSTLEKRQLQTSLRTGRLETAKLEAYRFAREVREDQVYWPLDGEYWRDELGTYRYTLRRGCASHRSEEAEERAGR